MNDAPKQGETPDHGEESPEFLCAIAAEAVNDAILLLAGVESPAEPILQRALAMLIDGATAQDALPPPLQPGRKRLSSRTVDLLVAQRLREAEAESCAAARKDLRTRLDRHPAALEPPRQKALMLMIEALSVLDQCEDLKALSHLQRAINHVVAPTCALHNDNGGKQRPN